MKMFEVFIETKGLVATLKMTNAETGEVLRSTSRTFSSKRELKAWLKGAKAGV